MHQKLSTTLMWIFNCTKEKMFSFLSVWPLHLTNTTGWWGRNFWLVSLWMPGACEDPVSLFIFASLFVMPDSGIEWFTMTVAVHNSLFQIPYLCLTAISSFLINECLYAKTPSNLFSEETLSSRNIGPITNENRNNSWNSIISRLQSSCPFSTHSVHSTQP